MKYFFGVVVGLVLGTVIVVATAIASFTSGLFLGWQLFADKDVTSTDASPITEEVTVS